MMTLVYAFATALIFSLVLGPFMIRELKKLKARQAIREEGPQRHQLKAGTPTMGGILIVAAVIVGTVLFTTVSTEIGLALFLTVGHGVIGFLDDFIKAHMKRNLGLTSKQKLACQLGMAAIFSFLLYHEHIGSTAIWIPGTALTIDCGLFYYVLVFFILVGTTNAVNLTDGLDGLAAGSSAITSIAFAVIAIALGYPALAIFSIALTGACLGFLFFNQYPAKVFMGDTGSLAIGGAFAALAILLKVELLLVLLGGLFVLEALSVILQVLSFKTRGVRIFKMSPIHHHFELSGWSEVKVVTVFWAVAAIFAVLSIVLVLNKAV